MADLEIASRRRDRAQEIRRRLQKEVIDQRDKLLFGVPIFWADATLVASARDARPLGRANAVGTRPERQSLQIESIGALIS